MPKYYNKTKVNNSTPPFGSIIPSTSTFNVFGDQSCFSPVVFIPTDIQGQSSKDIILETEKNVNSESTVTSQNQHENKNCCGICLTSYKSPRILPCKHIFCRLCLTKLAGKNVNQNYFFAIRQVDDEQCDDKQEHVYSDSDKIQVVLACPLCRQVIKLSVYEIDNLPMYFEDGDNDNDKAIKDEFVDKDSDDNADNEDNNDDEDQKVLCVICENSVPAEYECFQCQKVLCVSCKRNHDIWLKHEVKDLKLDLAQVKCLKHPEVEVGYLCLDCGTTLCKECVKSEHSLHQTQTIKSYLKEVERDLKDYSSKIEKKLETVEMSTVLFSSKTDSKICTQINRVKCLGEDFKMDIEKACRYENKKQHEDKALLNRINFTGRRIKKSKRQRKFNQSLMSEIKELKDKITTHEKFYLPNNVDDIIKKQIGTMDIQMGRLFRFQLKDKVNGQFDFFFGNLNWTLQYVAAHDGFNNRLHVQCFSLTPFIKAEDSLLIESITTTATLYVEKGAEDVTVSKKFTKTFRSSEDNVNWDYASTAICVKVLFQNTKIKHRTQVELP